MTGAPFGTSGRALAQLDASTIDYAVLPPWESLYPEAAETWAGGDDAAVGLRVPLLPDNFNPDRGAAAHGPEVLDGPLAAPEIHVLAAHPESVVPAALTEVEPMGLDGVELNFAHDAAAEAREPGMIRDLWNGLVEDIFGADKKAGPR